MNVGFIAGQVIGTDGNYASGAVVVLTRIVGDNGTFPCTFPFLDEDGGRPPVFTTTNRLGQFRIKFQWSGADIGSVITPPFLFLQAWTDEERHSGGVYSSAITSKCVAQVRGYLVKNVLEMTQQGVSTFKARDDIMDFAKELGKMSVGMMTTESWILVAGLYMRLS